MRIRALSPWSAAAASNQGIPSAIALKGPPKPRALDNSSRNEDTTAEDVEVIGEEDEAGTARDRTRHPPPRLRRFNPNRQRPRLPTRSA